jgi:hypothetical protein
MYIYTYMDIHRFSDFQQDLWICRRWFHISSFYFNARMANISLKVKTCIKQEKSEPKVKTEQPKCNTAVYTTDLIALECTQQLGSKTSTVQLEKGPDQFLVAHFSNGTHVTELSNLILAAALAVKIKKKPAAAKKPAASVPADAAPSPVPADAAPSPELESAAPSPRTYQLLWYKNGNNVGVRQTFGPKRQIFSFGGKRCTKSKERLLEIGKQVVKDLQAGLAPDKAKTNARNLASA